jgi:hypothetical protein
VAAAYQCLTHVRQSRFTALLDRERGEFDEDIVVQLANCLDAGNGHKLWTQGRESVNVAYVFHGSNNVNSLCVDERAPGLRDYADDAEVEIAQFRVFLAFEKEDLRDLLPDISESDE